MEPRDILNTEEGAQLLRMSKAKLRELANGGQVPAFRVGNRLRYRRSDLLQWVELQALANIEGDGRWWPRTWSKEKIHDTVRLERLFVEQYGHAPSTDLVGWAKFITSEKHRTDGAAE